MPKAAKGKSSASSGTRKKNAVKAAKKGGGQAQGQEDQDANKVGSSKPAKANQPAQRGEKRSKKQRKEELAKAKKKSFVPPPKPPQPPPDPLDSLGLASILQPELVVLLRKLSKKDVVTRERALEALKNWLQGLDSDGKMIEDWQMEVRSNDALVMLPSWLHLFPRLSISPTRKLRLLTAQILSHLASIPQVGQELLFNPTNQESFLGPFSILTWDNDKSVSKTCRDLWDSNFSSVHNLSTSSASMSSSIQNNQEKEAKLTLNPEIFEILLNHLSNLLLSESPSHFLSLSFASQAPVSIHNASANGHPSSGGGGGRDVKSRDEMNLEEGTEDTDDRLKSAALGCLNWIVETLSNQPGPTPTLVSDSNPQVPSTSESNSFKFPENLCQLLKTPIIYSSLIGDKTSIPALRIKTYQLLNTLNNSKVGKDFFEKEILEMISPKVPLSLWKEKDLLVMRSGIDTLLPIFRNHPRIWESRSEMKESRPNRGTDDGDEDHDDDEEDGDDSEEDEQDQDQDQDEASASDSDSGSGSEGEENQVSKKVPPSSNPIYPCYSGFKQFLEAGLSPAPQLCYPTILLFLTTIPSNILPNNFEASDDLLKAFIKPFGSRDLDSDNRNDINAFLTAFLESFAWLNRRIFKDGSPEEAIQFRDHWLKIIWNNFVLGVQSQGSSQDEEGEGGENKEETSSTHEGALNRKARSYNSISNPRLSDEFNSTFRKVFQFSDDLNPLTKLLDFFKESLHNLLDSHGRKKSRRDSEKVLNRCIAIFETLVKNDDNQNLHLKAEVMEKVQGLIQDLIRDSVNSLSPSSSSSSSSSSEVQQRNLYFLSACINSRSFRSNLNLSETTRGYFTSLSEEILPKIISEGRIEGRNHAELIGSVMRLLNESKGNPASSSSSSSSPSSSPSTSKQIQHSSSGTKPGESVWIKALQASIMLKDEKSRIGNIYQILKAQEESLRPKSSNMMTESREPQEGQGEGDGDEKPLDEISISLTSQFCSSDDGELPDSDLEKLVEFILLSDEKGSFAINQEKIDEILFILASKIIGVHSTFISCFSSHRSKTHKRISHQDLKDLESLIPVLRVFKSWISVHPTKKFQKLKNRDLLSEIPKCIFEFSFFQDTKDHGRGGNVETENLEKIRNVAAEIWQTLGKDQDQAQHQDQDQDQGQGQDQNEGLKKELVEIATRSLSRRLQECEIPLDVIIRASKDSLPRTSEASHPSHSHLVDLLLPVEELEKLAVERASVEPASILNILDPLVPLSNSTSTSKSSSTKVEFDPQGFSIYSRLSILLSKSIENDNRFAKSISSWSIPHLLLLSLAIEDKLSDESSSSNHFFNANCDLVELKTTFRAIIRSLTSLISSLCNDLSDDWHVETVAILQRENGDGNKSTDSQSHDPLRSSLLQAYRLAKSNSRSSVQFSRVFNRLLSGILSFSSVSSSDGERWLKLGQSFMMQHPLLASSIFYPVKSLASSTPFYDRLRNDLASRLTGVPASKANEEGIKLLTLLLSVAPNADTGDIALIPQQRSIFLLQTIQKWFASDEDFEDEMNCKLIQLFIHLLPIVQDLQGSHLDLMFDLLENNLELVEMKEKEYWPMIYLSLRFLELIRDLSSSNKSLKAAWKERKDPILEKVHDLFLDSAPDPPTHGSSTSESTASDLTCVPREMIADSLVDLVREVPSGAFSNQKDQEILIRLITGTTGNGSHDGYSQEISREIQVVAYKLLNACVSDKVRELVVEAAVGRPQPAEGGGGEDNADENSQSVQQSSTPSPLDLTLPSALVEVVSASVNSLTAQMLLEDESSIEELEDEDEIISDLQTVRRGRKTVFGLLLCWMAIFDHFEEASLQIRSAYLAQIEKMDLAQGLAITVFNLINPRGSGVPSFEAGKWGIEEVGLDDLDISSNGLALQALASHVYLRSLIHLPNLIRSWWFSLKDRQLSMSVSSFTIRHCSPLISSRELSHLRRQDSLSKLEDEAMTIKFQGSNEVVATYVVDEHPIEMGVKIPNDFPLRAIEIRDPADPGKRVAVSEDQWRSWIFASQQLMNSKNGLILDALMLFKRNAEAKFAGFEGSECAICYSIISPTDRSLPIKPCPTCKNRFHASCLFKWVTTSGSSTCPLCRSVI